MLVELLVFSEEPLEFAEDDVIPELIISNGFCGVVSPLHAVRVALSQNLCKPQTCIKQNLSVPARAHSGMRSP